MTSSPGATKSGLATTVPGARPSSFTADQVIGPSDENGARSLFSSIAPTATLSV